eukprot:4819499-Prymnesium_polylepis.1
MTTDGRVSVPMTLCRFLRETSSATYELCSWLRSYTFHTLASRLLSGDFGLPTPLRRTHGAYRTGCLALSCGSRAFLFYSLRPSEVVRICQ